MKGEPPRIVPGGSLEGTRSRHGTPAAEEDPNRAKSEAMSSKDGSRSQTKKAGVAASAPEHPEGAFELPRNLHADRRPVKGLRPPIDDLGLALRLESSIARLSRRSEALTREQAAAILLDLVGYGFSSKTLRQIEDERPSAEHCRRLGLLLFTGALSLTEMARTATDLALDALARGEQLDTRDILVIGTVLDRRLVDLKTDDPDDGSPSPEPLRDDKRITYCDPAELEELADTRKGDRFTCGGGRRVRKPTSLD